MVLWLIFYITIEEDKTGDENNLRQRGQQNLSGANVGGQEKRQESMLYFLFIEIILGRSMLNPNVYVFFCKTNLE